MSDTGLTIDVLDAKGEQITDARVSFVYGSGQDGTLQAKFDKKSLRYRIADARPGAGEIKVDHPVLVGQTRKVRIGSGDAVHLFILGEKEQKTYFREKVRVPIAADPNLIAITLDRRHRGESKRVEALMRATRLRPLETPKLAQTAGMMMFRVPAARYAEILKRLSEDPTVEHAGAVVSQNERGFSHLTREIVVQFVGPRMEEVRRIAKEHGYSLVRELVYAPNTYVLQWSEPATLAILDSIERIAQREDVAWAEPSLVVSPELDAIIPTDPHWPGLWDRQLIGCQDAWQHLQDAGIAPFGDPNILLAVWDSGIQSAGGQPTNADFQGTVSNGQTKVFAVFDFDNMVANNDAPWDTHGSGVAGVSVAMANNPSPVPGQTFGLVGSAPNVQIMSVAGRLPYVDIEVGDQYIWMAGFDPQSPLAGFPAQLTRGADVITCSLTPGANAPLSGTARATLDFVTTFGRSGKGTMCFFSTGNANQNNVTARPYGAYEKCFGITAISIADDGVTEVRAPYSGWGQVALCSPSQDQAPTVHNPPAGYMPWGAHHLGAGNLISFVQSQTTLAAASAAGATALTVATMAGFAVNAVIHVGAFGGTGSEPARITAVNAMTNQLTVQGFNGNIFTGALLNAHAAGTVVLTGPPNHRNNFGGTSSATPLCAGVAALVLSANPDLTYIEAREILRNTAIKLDLLNTDPTGQWLDANGNPSVGSGLPAVRSQWYGWGRVDAAAAVQAAIDFADTRDLVIRDNLADTGAVSSSGAFWDSPDIWCRTTAPGVDPGALPAGYGVAGPHQNPVRGQSNWVYARVHNNGTVASLDAWVRLSVTHWPGTEFTWPASFQPTTGPGDPLPSPLAPGTYFIGEAKVTNLGPGADQTISVEWPSSLIPPETVPAPGGPVHWHPCLLAEITPHDGPVPSGNHIWDDNNLAQKNITIVDTDAGADVAAAFVIGHHDNEAEFLYLDVSRGRLARNVQLYIDLLDPVLRRRIRALEDKVGRLPDTFVAPRREWWFGRHEGREVLMLAPLGRVRIALPVGAGRPAALVIGGITPRNVKPGRYRIVLIQRQPDLSVSGSCAVDLAIGMKKDGKVKKVQGKTRRRELA